MVVFLLCSSCVEYRFSRPEIPDKYLGWGNTIPCLDPKMGPRAKAFLTPNGKTRPYIGGEIIHQEELILGVGVIYYDNENRSYEIGIRDSVYRNTDLSSRYKQDDGVDTWQDNNPMLFIGGVWRF